jgi:uncharacterized protein (UPF0218 family)
MEIKISEELRKKLKKPLGKLVKNRDLKKFFKSLRQKKLKIIAVGDVTGKKLIEAGISPDLWIYDGKEMRKKVKWEIPLPTHYAKNPRGKITESLQKAIDDAIKTKNSRVFVDGEEDLSALYCLLKFNALILYGQPKKGIVAVYPSKKPKINL